VVVSAGAKVLGGFEVGDGAKIGSNAVVIKPVPAGATAVGIPARIIQSKADESADVAGSQPKFSAYGITQEDDPVSQALRGLIDSAATQDQQIARLWLALEKICQQQQLQMPEGDRGDCFEAERLNQLVGK
jgi:serine O-acetyltransferase